MGYIRSGVCGASIWQNRDAVSTTRRLQASASDRLGRVLQINLRFGGAGVDGLRNRRSDFIKRHSEMCFRMQHNHGSRAGIFSGVMMVETQIQHLFQIGQTMPAIAFQLGPGPSGNPDAVAPAERRRLKAQKTMGGVDGLFVKVAVLNEMVPGKQRQKGFKRLMEGQGVCHMIRPDPVQANVEGIKVGARIDEHGKCLDAIIGLNAGEAYLADAGGIAAGGFNIQCDEAKIPMWDVADMLKVWAKSGDHILDCWALQVDGVRSGFFSMRFFGSVSHNTRRRWRKRVSDC